MRQRQIMIAFSLAVLLACTALARDYYVGKENCSNSGQGSFENPWCTIQKAADSADAGDTVFVMEGNYPEKVQLRKSGSPGKYITYRPFETDKVTLNPGSFAGYDAGYLKIVGFHIMNSPDKRSAIRFYGKAGFVEIRDNEVSDSRMGYSGVIEVGGYMHHFIIDGNHVHDCDTGTAEGIKVFQHASDFNITDNLVENNTNIGIVVNGWSHWGKPKNGLIRNNTVRYNSKKAPFSAGIYLDCTNDMIVEYNVAYGNIRGLQLGCEKPDDVSEDNIVRYNIAYGNTGSGMHVGGYQGGMTRDNLIHNNVFYENGMNEIGFDGTPGEDNEFYNNILYDADTTLVWGQGDANAFDHNLYIGNNGPGNDNIMKNPRFIAAQERDFRLKEDSPACGEGRDGADIGRYSCSGCGDGRCSADEDCLSCQDDCSSCICEPKWNCSGWSGCDGGEQSTTCADLLCGEPDRTISKQCECIDKASIMRSVQDWRAGNLGISELLRLVVEWIRGC